MRKVLVLLFAMMLFAHAAGVSCTPRWTSPTTGQPGAPQLPVSGTITLSLAPNCTGGTTFSSVVLFVGCPDALGFTCPDGWPAQNPFPNWYISIPKGSATTFQFDTTTVPNAEYDFGCALLNGGGNAIGSCHDGTGDHDQMLIVSNPAARPSPAPTPQAACMPTITSPASGATVSGNVPFTFSAQGCPLGFFRLYGLNQKSDNGTLDSTKAPNGPNGAGAILWDNSGLVLEAKVPSIPLIVCNGAGCGGPRPAPTASPTPAPCH